MAGDPGPELVAAGEALVAWADADHGGEIWAMEALGNAGIVDRVRAAVAAARRRHVPSREDLERSLARQSAEVCQTLGRALGMPWYKDDPANFPGATEADGVCYGDHVPESIAAAAADRIRALEAEAAGLRAAVARHHAQRADDRCVFDDDELYAAAGLPPADRRVGDKFAMLANCARFIDRRCDGGGPWKSYAELEAELAAWKGLAERASETLHNPADMRPEEVGTGEEGLWRIMQDVGSMLCRGPTLTGAASGG